MQHSDFEIGMEFFSETGMWRCTDVGRRTIVAAKVKDGNPPAHKTPPFSDAVEVVFDEYDILGLSREQIMTGA